MPRVFKHYSVRRFKRLVWWLRSVKCPGCGQRFKNARGVKQHQRMDDQCPLSPLYNFAVPKMTEGEAIAWWNQQKGAAQ